MSRIKVVVPAFVLLLSALPLAAQARWAETHQKHDTIILDFNKLPDTSPFALGRAAERLSPMSPSFMPAPSQPQYASAAQ